MKEDLIQPHPAETGLPVDGRLGNLRVLVAAVSLSASGLPSQGLAQLAAPGKPSAGAVHGSAAAGPAGKGSLMRPRSNDKGASQSSAFDLKAVGSDDKTITVISPAPPPPAPPPAGSVVPKTALTAPSKGPEKTVILPPPPSPAPPAAGKTTDRSGLGK